MKLLFRRATHDAVTGKYKEEIFAEEKLTNFMNKVWKAHGNICHLLSSKEPMSYDDLLEEIRKDVTNFDYHPSDLEVWRDGSPIPCPKDVALSLIRLVEAGFVEVVPDEIERIK